MNLNWGAWLYGLFAAFFGAFATAATGALTMPGVFNFSHDGLINFLKISVVPALIAFFAYIQQHPLPVETTVLKQTKTAEGATDTTLTQTKTTPLPKES